MQITAVTIVVALSCLTSIAWCDVYFTQDSGHGIELATIVNGSPSVIGALPSNSSYVGTYVGAVNDGVYYTVLGYRYGGYALLPLVSVSLDGSIPTIHQVIERDNYKSPRYLGSDHKSEQLLYVTSNSNQNFVYRTSLDGVIDTSGSGYGQYSAITARPNKQRFYGTSQNFATVTDLSNKTCRNPVNTGRYYNSMYPLPPGSFGFPSEYDLILFLGHGTDYVPVMGIYLFEYPEDPSFPPGDIPTCISAIIPLSLAYGEFKQPQSTTLAFDKDNSVVSAYWVAGNTLYATDLPSGKTTIYSDEFPTSGKGLVFA